MKPFKYQLPPKIVRRPFTGAWIETRAVVSVPTVCWVAPSRGRGLKHPQEIHSHRGFRRPFTGAWIETLQRFPV